MNKPLRILLPVLVCLANIAFGQAFSVTATATTPTICLGNSTSLTATATPVSYAGSVIPYNPIPGAGTNILCSGGALDGTNPITPSVNGNPVSSLFLDDSRWDNISIPFPFTYFGTDYNQVCISTNGWVGLGGTSSTATGFGQVIPNASVANNVVFGVLADLTFRTASGGTIEYFTDGSFPNLKFVVLFTGMHFISGGGAGDVEIIFNYGSNTIEIHTSVITNTTLAKTQGVENGGGTVAVATPGKNGTANWGASTGAYKFTPETITYSWSPSTGLSSTTGKTVTATPSVTTTYTVTATNSVPTNATNTVTVTIDPASNTLAGTAGGGGIFHNIVVSPTGTFYRDMSNCNVIAHILPSGGSPVSNSINTSVQVANSSTKWGTSDLYLARKYDIEPVVNASTSSATITLYFLQSEFNNFNIKATDSGHKLLPTGPGDAAGISNLILRQFHGTGTNPTNYSGSSQDFSTATSGFTVTWNATHSRWEVVVPVTGFSGFYLTSQKSIPVPVKLIYFKGAQAGRQHLLSWQSECTSTEAKFELQRSADGIHFTSLTKITATQARCAQPFDFTDANVLPGVNYYRLKSIDVDGKYDYSNIVLLTAKTKGFTIAGISPNPIARVNAVLKINAGDKTEMNIVITDFSGRIINRQTVSLNNGINQVILETSTLSSGAYQVTGYTANEKPQTVKFIKQ